MTQLLCNGVLLDLYEDTNLQFKRENQLFAFDDLGCERSTQIKIPCTHKNDRVFELARVPAYDGAGMRRKFNTQLQAGGVVKNGYLYVSQYDGKDYTAIFVTGEFVGLQEIKNAGDLSEIMQYDEYLTAHQNIYNANDGALDGMLFAHMRYLADGRIQPSINVGLLIDKICAHLNILCATPAQAYKMRIAPYELVLPKKEVAHMHSTNTGDVPINTIYPNELQRITIDQASVGATFTRTYHNGYNNPFGEVVQEDASTQTVVEFKTLNNIVLKMPEDLSYKYVLIRLNDLVSGGAVFYGGYSFTKATPGVGQYAPAVFTGEPLAGRSIKIPAGQNFILASADDYIVTCRNTIIQIDDEPVPVTETTRGWEFSNGLEYNFEVEIEPQSEEAQSGDVVRLQDNLPQITFTHLLKALAFELGYALNYSEENGITFDSINYADSPVLDIRNIVKRGELVRGFADYKQQNFVRYAEDKAFLDAEQTPVIYTIDNDNLQEEKDLSTLPWTNGSTYASDYGDEVQNRAGRSQWLELRAGSSSYAMRAYITKNANLQALCTASTQYKINVRMNLFEYENITPKHAILVDNTRYVWVSLSWKKDIATLTLQKMP